VARPVPRNDEERQLLGDTAFRVFGLADLAPAADIAVAITGVSGGPLLAGVSYGSGYAETTSLVMSIRHATVRRLTTRHLRVGGVA
jgi:fructose-1,6-bisphosphatase/sedoheptulose 1,7-bisphosphatase-like protein